MKRLFIIGNWKAHKTVAESESWFRYFVDNKLEIAHEEKHIIVAAPFTLLPFATQWVKAHELPFALAAQDISPFGPGAYTGEVTGEQLAEFVSYVLIGHSERRKYFHEDDTLLEGKVAQALSAGLTPIFCVTGADIPVPDGVTLIAYEPTFAIGSGTPDTPENADAVAAALKEKYPSAAVIYGGSVTADNVASFLSREHLDGVLPGGASLEPQSFAQLITQS